MLKQSRAVTLVTGHSGVIVPKKSVWTNRRVCSHKTTCCCEVATVGKEPPKIEKVFGFDHRILGRAIVSVRQEISNVHAELWRFVTNL